jgi:hypothetical protein
MFFSHTPKSRMRYVLVFGITALVIVSPATETPASQKDDPREHPPKLLNYSKMTTPRASRASTSCTVSSCNIGSSLLDGSQGSEPTGL